MVPQVHKKKLRTPIVMKINIKTGINIIFLSTGLKDNYMKK